MIRAMIIDPFKETVEAFEMKDGEYTTLQEHVGQEDIESVGLGGGVRAFVDGMGLYRKGQRYWFFDMEGGRVLMAGRAVLVSVDDIGEVVPLTVRALAEETRKIIHWAGDAQGAESAIAEGKVGRPSMAINGEPVWTWNPSEERL